MILTSVKKRKNSAHILASEIKYILYAVAARGRHDISRLR